MGNIFKQIAVIHPKVEIKNNILHLIGNVRGNDLEKIRFMWDGPIYADSLIGTYHHPSEFPLKVGRNCGLITGDLSNANICCKTKKKLKKEKKRLLLGKGWNNISSK